ncbi:MAG TPA: hypothetical protein VK639_04370, partial [Terriglobales bacterium]|nr:hypothetical protein [Terriglobales bacterium]
MKTTTQHLYARPFNGTKQRMTNHFLIFILALVGAQANAITIDFAQIPDGTLASANNPCAGTLNIQAENGHGVLADGLQYSLVWTEASIRNGALEALPTRGANDVGYYYSRVIANFLQPVTDASFSVFTWRPGVYSYIGEDGSGNVFRGSGHTAWDFTQVPGDWLTIDLDLPAGYFLTSFA